MKKHLAILLIFSLLSPYLVSAQSDPCQDKEFLRLKDVSINDMSDREYKYFMMMSERCTGNEEKVQTATLQYPELDSTEKRAEFNRKRLTIKTKTTSSASGSAVELFDTGIYVGGAKVSENAEWIPYRGFSTISVVEFLEVSGNEREANNIRKWLDGNIENNYDKYSKADIAGYLAYFLSLGFSFVLFVIGLSRHIDFEGYWTDDETVKTSYISSVVFAVISVLIHRTNPIVNDEAEKMRFRSFSKDLVKVGYTNIFPITQAVEMADGYNRQLWREMTNR